MTQEEKTWEIGDIIISHARRVAKSELEKIVAFTKAGNYKTDRKRIYYPDGVERSSNTWHRRYARLATEEDIKELVEKEEKRKLIEKKSGIRILIKSR